MIDYKGILRLAKAIFLFIEKKVEDPHKNITELRLINNILQTNKKLLLFLRYPQINYEDKISLLNNIMDNLAISDTTRYILFYLLRKDKLVNLDKIIDVVNKLVYEKENKEEVEVFTRFRLLKEQEERLKSILESKLNKEVILKLIYKPEIIGGIILRIRDNLIDASVRYYLNALKSKL